MKHIFFPLLFFSLIWGCSDSRIANNAANFSKVAPGDRSLHREMEKVYFQFGDISTEGITHSQRDQTLFKAYQKLLTRYPNSARLLSTLARHGYQIYPEQSLVYATHAIEMEPSRVESYILSSQCHQILGDYANALSTLKQGRNVAISRLLYELKKPRPYYEPGWHKFSTAEINEAKAYLRNRGYDPGEDVNYKIPKGQVGMNNGMCVMDVAYILADGTVTNISDFVELDRINAYIKAIENNNPYWDPSDRVEPPINDDAMSHE